MKKCSAVFGTHLKATVRDCSSITEQTDAWVRFDLTAAKPADLMEKLSNIDVTRVPDEYASHTTIDQFGCYLVRQNANKVTHYGPKSSVDSLLHALKMAAESLL